MPSNPWALTDEQAAVLTTQAEAGPEFNIMVSFFSVVEASFATDLPSDVRKDVWRLGLIAVRKVIRAEHQTKMEEWLRKQYFNKDATKRLMASAEAGTAHMQKEAVSAVEAFVTLLETLNLETKP